MSANELVSPINWDLALHDLMNDICKNLDPVDLKNVAKVNKAWRDVAVREISNTFYIQQLRFPYKFGDPEKLKQTFLHARKRRCLSLICLYECFVKGFSRRNVMSPNTPALASLLYQKPYASLLIYDWRLRQSCVGDDAWLKGILLEDSKFFNKDLPNNVLALEVDECLTTEDLEFEGLKGQLRPSGNHDIVGLFFPNLEKRARVRVAWQSEMYASETAARRVDYLAERLGLNESECSKSTLLWFVEPYTTGPRLMSEIQKKYFNNNSAKNNTVTWMGELGGAIVAVSESEGCGPIYPVIAGLRISGPSVESWTARIDLRSPREDVDKELRALKEKVVLKRYCTGLLCAPCRNPYGRNKEIMSKLKRIFRGISFVGLFDDHRHTVYVRDLPADSLTLRNSDITYMITRYQHMSIIILTYD